MARSESGTHNANNKLLTYVPTTVL